MEFTKTTGMMWAKSAGCNQIRAIFATGRAPRVYKSTEFEVNGVHISFTVYAKTANQGFSIQTILGFLPASCASDRDALTVDQTPRRGQIQFNELQKHSVQQLEELQSVMSQRPKIHPSKSGEISDWDESAWNSRINDKANRLWTEGRCFLERHEQGNGHDYRFTSAEQCLGLASAATCEEVMATAREIGPLLL
eukprot:s7236_g3.t2